jgi:hypothetical protein
MTSLSIVVAAMAAGNVLFFYNGEIVYPAVIRNNTIN